MCGIGAFLNKMGDVVYLWERGVYFRSFFYIGLGVPVSSAVFSLSGNVSVNTRVQPPGIIIYIVLVFYYNIHCFILKLLLAYLLTAEITSIVSMTIYTYNPTFGNFVGFTPMHTIQIRVFNFPKVISVRFVHDIFPIL